MHRAVLKDSLRGKYAAQIFINKKVRNINVCYFCLLKINHLLTQAIPKIMEINGYSDLMEKFRQMVAENQSLSAREEESRQAIREKEEEIARLKQMVAQAGAVQSTMDSKLEEMQYLQDYMGEMKQLMAGVSIQGIANPMAEQNSDAAAELEEMKELNTYHQIQLKDLKEQVKALKARNEELEQKAARAAELESLLANAIEEKNEWKSFIMNKG